ncbi:MAG: glycosyltransferase family 39 protein [Candidatus Brocadiaceae bacterium]
MQGKSESCAENAPAPGGFWAGRAADRREWLLVGAILVAALGVRLAYLDPTLSSTDFLGYPATATALVTEGPMGPFTTSPLYTYFWVLMVKAFGSALFWPRVTQLVLGSGSCVLLYFVGRSLFGRASGAVAALAAVIYAPSIAHEGDFQPAFLVVLANSVFLLAAIHARGRRSFWAWGLAGAALGLSAVVRANVLLLAPFALLWLWWSHRRGRGQLIGSVAAFCAACALPVGSITLRNYVVSGDPVMSMTDAGIVMYISNNALDRGPSYFWPHGVPLARSGEVDPTHRVTRELASRMVGRELTHSEASHFWMGRALAFVREHPGEWLLLEARKLYFFFHRYEVPDAISQHDKLHRLGRRPLLHFGIVAPLALLGMAVAGRRWRELILLYGLVCVYVLTALVFGVQARYRLPIVPAMILFAVLGGRWWLVALHRRRWVHIICATVPLASLFWWLNAWNYWTWSIDAQFQTDLEHYSIAGVYVEAGDYDKAIPHLEAVLQQDTTYGSICGAHQMLARIYRERGDTDRANREWYAAFGPLCWDGAGAQPVPSREALEARVRRDRYDIFALRDLAYACWRDGDYASARRHAERVVYLAPGAPIAHYNLAAICARLGEEERARRHLRLALDLRPDVEPARELLRTLEGAPADEVRIGR